MAPFSLPSFVPSNLQHSLLSYLVRRFLGPLLKNGAQSLDQQLSTPKHPGIFLLRNVRIDPQALEVYLSDSASPFIIDAVSVSELSLEINWPSWSLSLQGYVPDVKITLRDIQVTLGLSDSQSNPLQHESQSLQNINLDENLANIANDFVREEWLDSSLDEPIEQDFPGAFTTKPNAAISSSGDEDRRGFFAGLVQKILSKFNFEFEGLTIVFNLDLLQVLLSIENGLSLAIASEDGQQSSGLSREIRIACPVVYLHHAFDQADAVSSPSCSSNESLNSEHDMLMSQAIVDLRGPSLYASAVEVLPPNDQHVSHEKPINSIESIIKPENVLLQFTGIPTSPSTQFARKDFSPDQKVSSQDFKASSEAEKVPQAENVTSQDRVPPLLDPRNSLRFLFWVPNALSSEVGSEDRSAPRPFDSIVAPDLKTTTPLGVRRPQLNIQIYLPTLNISVRLPRHHVALTKLFSTLLPLMRSTPSCPESNLTGSSSDQIPSSAIHTTLTLHSLDFTVYFPYPYPKSSYHNDMPLSSLGITVHQVKLTYDTLPTVGVHENPPTPMGSELTIQLDQIHGTWVVSSAKPSTLMKSTFLVVPAREDPSPAVSIWRRADMSQLVFSPIWLNINLEFVTVLIPLMEVAQSTFSIPETNPCSTTRETISPVNPRVGVTDDKSSNDEAMDNPKFRGKCTTTVSIPCLYVDIQPPRQQKIQSQDRRQPNLILGSVVKTLKVITSQNQISCTLFEAAIGFRVRNDSEGLLQAPLSPFLGVAHSILPASTTHHDRYPGLRLTHKYADPSPVQSDKSQQCPKSTNIKLETVTIDLTKDQFDRLQYWLDDVGQWSNNLLVDLPRSEDPIKHRSSGHATLLPPPRSTKTPIENQSKQKGDNEATSAPEPSTLLGSLTVSQLAVTLRLSVPGHDSNQTPVKLVLQMQNFSLHHIRPTSPGPIDSELQLKIQTCLAFLHQPNSQTLPLIQALRRNESKSLVLPAVSASFRTAQSQSTSPENKTISIGVEVNDTTLRLGPNCVWVSELFKFLKAPAGVFAAVGPEYATRVTFLFVGCAIQLVSPPSSALSNLSNSPPPTNDSSSSGFVVEVLSNHTQLQVCLDPLTTSVSPRLDGSISILLAEYPNPSFLRSETISFAQIASINDMHVSALYSWAPEQPPCRLTLHQGKLTISFCADSADSFAEAITRLSEIPFQAKEELTVNEAGSLSTKEAMDDPIVESVMLRSAMKESSSSSRSILIQRSEDLAEEDYPTDVAYIHDNVLPSRRSEQPVEPKSLATIRPLVDGGLSIIDDFLLNKKPPSTVSHQTTEAEVKVENLDVLIKFHDGYDWDSTRQAIQDARKTVRKRLQKIRQLLATGNPVDARSMEEDLLPTTLFESLHLGLNPPPHDLSAAQLLKVIDNELGKGITDSPAEDVESMTGSWQSLAPQSTKDQSGARGTSSLAKHRHLNRSTKAMLKVVLSRLQGSFRKFKPDQQHQGMKLNPEGGDFRLNSLQLKCDSLTIIDNVPTSTWKKFLTELRPSEGGMLRPTGAPMLRFKFDANSSATTSRLKEATIKVKISPLRLYVDQDAVDFLKGFFAFRKSPLQSPPNPAADPNGAAREEMFFQRVEILPIRIKLDYKPKRVNYMALKEGKTIELMNFFHFEGSDMVLRHVTLTGVSRASKIGELLQEIWTPDVKANQLADVISGISPVRSVVNLGTGIADLVLLPIEEIKKKDGRLSRGIQKGTNSFAKNTTLEVIKLGAKLAIGTQVILEKAESILGAKLNQEIRVEAIDHRSNDLHHEVIVDSIDNDDDSIMNVQRTLSRVKLSSSPDLVDSNDHHDRISKYAVQPRNLKVGAQLAYQDLRENFRSTAQTILAVPLEVFNEGSGQAVVKAIPIAFLHPMVGATGAISKTLLGLQNSIDPTSSSSNLQDKYKGTSS